MTFKQWLENFWYHYKWTVIVVAFFVAVAVVGIVQMVNRPQYDTSVCLASPYKMNKEELTEEQKAELKEKFGERKELTEEQKQKAIAEFIENVKIDISEAVSEYVLDIGITLRRVGRTPASGNGNGVIKLFNIFPDDQKGVAVNRQVKTVILQRVLCTAGKIAQKITKIRAVTKAKDDQRRQNDSQDRPKAEGNPQLFIDRFRLLSLYLLVHKVSF